MGYRHRIPHVAVAFEEGHEYHGCEVTLRALNLGEFLDLMQLNPDSAVRNIGDQLIIMGDKLVSWNLEDPDTGEPVPVTRDAVLQQDKDLMIAVLNAWADVLRGVSDPLPETSSGGEPSLEASLPMAPQSQSLAS